MNNIKPWWTSKILWASLVSVLFAIGAALGLLPEGLTEEGVTEAIMGVIGVLIVLFRFGSNTKIG